MELPVFVTVDPARIAKPAAEPRLTGVPQLEGDGVVDGDGDGVVDGDGDGVVDGDGDGKVEGDGDGKGEGDGDGKGEGDGVGNGMPLHVAVLTTGGMLGKWLRGAPCLQLCQKFALAESLMSMLWLVSAIRPEAGSE